MLSFLFIPDVEIIRGYSFTITNVYCGTGDPDVPGGGKRDERS